MTFILILLTWAAFIAALFAILESVMRGNSVKTYFLAYFLAGFYGAFAWLAVLTILKLLAPDLEMNHFFMFTPLFPPLSCTITAALRLMRKD